MNQPLYLRIGWLMLGTEYGSLEHQEGCSIARQSRETKSRICDLQSL